MSEPRTYGGESREERTSRRRRSFLDAGLEVFGTTGYRAATVRHLCREAGVTDRYFYAEFASTEELLLAVYDECTARLLDAVVAATAGLGTGPQPAVETLAQVALDAFLGVIEDDRRLARVVWFEVLGVSADVERHYLAGMGDFGGLVVGLLASHGELAPLGETAVETMTAAAVGAINHVTMSWVAADLATPRALLVEPLAAFLAHASRAMLTE